MVCPQNGTAVLKVVVDIPLLGKSERKKYDIAGVMQVDVLTYYFLLKFIENDILSRQYSDVSFFVGFNFLFEDFLAPGLHYPQKKMDNCRVE